MSPRAALQAVGGRTGASGAVGLTIVRQRMAQEGKPPEFRSGRGAARFSLAEVWRRGLAPSDSPYPEIRDEINRFRRANRRLLLRGIPKIQIAQTLGIPTFWGALDLTIFRASGRAIPLGLVGLKVVTTVGVGFIVDAFQNLVELETEKYHGLGTGSTAEAAGDTALVTELMTEYTGNVRATGTTAEASATVYRTVATNTLDGTPGAALREHGLFSADAVGVLFDRTVYGAITLVSGDGLQSTYDGTFSAGG